MKQHTLRRGVTAAATLAAVTAVVLYGSHQALTPALAGITDTAAVQAITLEPRRVDTDTATSACMTVTSADDESPAETRLWATILPSPDGDVFGDTDDAATTPTDDAATSDIGTATPSVRVVLERVDLGTESCAVAVATGVVFDGPLAAHPNALTTRHAERRTALHSGRAFTDAQRQQTYRVTLNLDAAAEVPAAMTPAVRFVWATPAA